MSQVTASLLRVSELLASKQAFVGTDMKRWVAWSLGISLVSLAASLGAQEKPEALDRMVSLTLPRCTLAKALQALSTAAKVRLTVAPALAEERLVGHVPGRSLKQTMDALAELYDARWTRIVGSEGFRLEPVPEKERSARAARQAYLAKLRAALDREGAESLAEAKNGGFPGDTESRARTRKLGMVLWAVLPAAARNKVLRGTPYTLSLPNAAARPVYQMLLLVTEKDDAPPVGPLLITYDLDEKGENMLPQVRARVTAMRKNSIIGAFGVLDLTTLVPLPLAPPSTTTRPDEPKLAASVGYGGRFVGIRDELAVKVAEGCGVPVLSRHRALPDSTYALNAANRTIGAVVDDLARQCDATASVTQSGFRLLRSNSEVIDSLYYPTPAIVERYLKTQPAVGKRVPFESVAPLAALSPIQIKVLQRSNTCTEAAEFAYDCYGLLRFYNTLSPAQRLRLFDASSPTAPPGLAVKGLSHGALHAFLDERTKRGDLNIYGELQDKGDLSLLFRQRPDQPEAPFMAKGLRGGEEKATATRELAEVNQEETPTAK